MQPREKLLVSPTATLEDTFANVTDVFPLTLSLERRPESEILAPAASSTGEEKDTVI